MNEKTLLQQLSEQGRNIITTKAAEADGVSREMLSKLCKAGTIQRSPGAVYVGRGYAGSAAVDQPEK